MSQDKQSNIHLAVVSDDDEYMGTVSLKNLESYINNEKENKDLTDKSWLNEEIFNLGEEIHFKEIKK